MAHSQSSPRPETPGSAPIGRADSPRAPPVRALDVPALRSWFLVVAVLAALPFLSALRNGFVNWDDHQFITNNPNIRSLAPANLRAMFTSFVEGNYIPLTQLSFAVNYRLHGLAPGGYHLANVLLHAVNAGLVLLLLLRAKAPAPWAAAGALLFAWHPMRVESVVWATERKDVLFACFYLLALLAYGRYLERGAARDRHLALLWFVLSGLSKQMALSLPAVLLLMDGMAGRRREWGLLREKAWFFAVSVALVLVAFAGQHASASLLAGTQYTPLHRLLLSCNSLAVYLKNIVWPVNLCCIYPYPKDVVAEAAYTPFLVGALAGMVAWFGRRFPPLVAGAVFFLLTLAPVLNVVPAGAQMVADRFTYLPAVGLSYVAVRAAMAWPARRALALGAAALLLLSLAVLSWNRTKVWHDDLTLWSDAVRKAPDAYIARSNLGLAFAANGNFAEALQQYDRAVELAPGLPDAYHNRAITHRELDHREAALADFTRALALNANARLWMGRAQIYYEAGDWDRAIADYTRAIAEYPALLDAQLERGICYGMQNDFRRAIDDFSAVLQQVPFNAQALFNRGKANFELGLYDPARADFNRAIQADAQFAKAYYHRAVVSLKLKRYDAAVRDLQEVEKLGYTLEPAVLEQVPPEYRWESP